MYKHKNTFSVLGLIIALPTLLSVTTNAANKPKDMDKPNKSAIEIFEEQFKEGPRVELSAEQSKSLVEAIRVLLSEIEQRRAAKNNISKVDPPIKVAAAKAVEDINKLYVDLKEQSAKAESAIVKGSTKAKNAIVKGSTRSMATLSNPFRTIKRILR